MKNGSQGTKQYMNLFSMNTAAESLFGTEMDSLLEVCHTSCAARQFRSGCFTPV